MSDEQLILLLLEMGLSLHDAYRTSDQAKQTECVERHDKARASVTAKFSALLERAEKAEAEVARLTARLQSAKSEVDEILRAALSGDCDRYLNYDLQGNKYCKWGVVSRDIAAVFDVTEPSDIDVSEQGFND